MDFLADDFLLDCLENKTFLKNSFGFLSFLLSEYLKYFNHPLKRISFDFANLSVYVFFNVSELFVEYKFFASDFLENDSIVCL